MSTKAEGGQSSQPIYATKRKKKGKGRQEHENYEESEDGMERWKRRERIVKIHELLPPRSSSDVSPMLVM